jgi:PAS domain S-box-containing protein
VFKANGVIGIYPSNALSEIEIESAFKDPEQLENFPGPYFLSNQESDLLYVNTFLRKISNFSRRNLQNAKITDLCCSNNDTHSLVPEKTKQINFNHFIRTKNNDLIPIVQITYTQSNKTETLYLGHITKTGTNPYFENNLEILRKIINTLQNQTWLFNCEGQVLHANDYALKKSGYQLNEFSGISVHDLHPLFREQPNRWKSVLDDLREKRRITIKDKLNTKKNLTVPVEITFSLLEIQSQKYIKSTIRNSNPEIKSLKSNKAWENIQKLTNNTKEIFWLQTRFQLIYINPALEETFGIPRSDIYFNPYGIIANIHTKDRNRILKEYGRLKETSLIKAEFRAVKPDGTVLWISGKIYPTEEHHNGCQVLLGIASDITHLKHKEFELTEEKKKAVEADRIKTSFLSTMSHELRTPLNSILGFSEIICMQSKEPNTLEHGEVIYKSGHNLLNIIENILTFTQLNSNSFKYKASCFYISEVMKTFSLERYSEKISFQREAIQFDYVPDQKENPPLCHADSQIILKIFDILIENALLYTPEGVIQYGYRTLNEKDIQFFVKDTGIGISAKNQKIILEYFRQADSSTTRKYGGIGLGLSIAHELIKLHKGKLSFHSELGKGSEFFFTLPCRIAESELAELASPGE